MATTRPFRTSRRVAVIAAVVTLALLAAACGDDDDDGGATGTSTATTAAATATTTGATTATTVDDGVPDDLDEDGVLSLVYDMNIFGEGFDPTKANAPGQWWNELIYGTLLRRTADGEYHDELATMDGTEIVDASTVKVELLPGLKYTDGTPLDATAVKAAIDRNVRIGTGKNLRMGELGAVASVTVNSPTTFTIALKTPTAGSFFDMLAHEETMPYVAATADAGPLGSSPVGAGPYMVQDFQQTSGFSLVKNPDYVHADDIRIPTIKVVSAAADGYTVALNSRNVDWLDFSIQLAQSVTAPGYKEIDIPNPDSMGFLWVACMTDRSPALADVRVRQALNYATDKAGLITATLSGKGEPMDQLWPNDSPYANPDLVNSYPYDVAKAKALLTEAGVSDLHLTFATPGGTATTTAEVLQAQWAEIGVDLEIIPTPDITTNFYTERKMDLYGTTAGVKRSWTDKLTRNWAPGSVGNTCDPSQPAYGGTPDFTAKLLELRGLERDDPRAVALWKEMAAMIVEGAFAVFMTRPPTVISINTEKVGFVGGKEIGEDRSIYWPTQVGVYYPDVHQAYIRQ